MLSELFCHQSLPQFTFICKVSVVDSITNVHHFSSSASLHPALAPAGPLPHSCLCLWVMQICICILINKYIKEKKIIVNNPKEGERAKPNTNGNIVHDFNYVKCLRNGEFIEAYNGLGITRDMGERNG